MKMQLDLAQALQAARPPPATSMPRTSLLNVLDLKYGKACLAVILF